MKAVWEHLNSSLVPALRDSNLNARRCQRFEEKFNIPGVVGVIDGSHIPLWRTYKSRLDPYYNRKGWMSIVLSAVVDAEGKFINIDVGAPGGQHDSSIFRSSAIGKWLQTYEAQQCLIRGKQFLLGDSAYQLRWFVMKAFDRRNKVPDDLKPSLGRVNKHISGKSCF